MSRGWRRYLHGRLDLQVELDDLLVADPQRHRRGRRRHLGRAGPGRAGRARAPPAGGGRGRAGLRGRGGAGAHGGECALALFPTALRPFPQELQGAVSPGTDPASPDGPTPTQQCCEAALSMRKENPDFPYLALIPSKGKFLEISRCQGLSSRQQKPFTIIPHNDSRQYFLHNFYFKLQRMLHTLMNLYLNRSARDQG